MSFSCDFYFNTLLTYELNVTYINLINESYEYVKNDNILGERIKHFKFSKLLAK